MAVTAVVFYHAGVPGLSGGFLGVDVFFVISGFLIAGIVFREFDEESFSYFAFYERRVRRIIPALFVMLMVSAAASYFILPPSDELAFGKDLASVIAFGSNIHFWRTIGYFGQRASNVPLLHTWSLGIEEQFYIIFPCCLVWLLRHNRRFAFRVLAIGGLFSLTLCVAWTELRSPETAFFLLPTRAWELLLGAAVAVRSWRLSELATVREIASIAAACGLIYTIRFFNEGMRLPGFATLLPTLSTAILLDANRNGKSKVSRVLSAPPLVGVGLTSYSLYLWHWPLLSFARYARGPLNRTELTGLLVACGVLAVLSWRWIEQPARARQSGGASFRTIVMLSGAACASLLAFCLADELTGGFRSHYSPLALTYLDGATDRDPDTMRCSNVRPSLVLRGGLCSFGPNSPAAARFLLWGDSHAGELMPTFRALASERRVRGLIATSPGCPPVLGTIRADVVSDCSQFDDSVVALIRRDTIRTVVLAGFWGRYLNEEEANGGFPQIRLKTRSGVTLDIYASKLAFEAAFARTIAVLTALGVNVYVVADIPVYRGLLSRLADAATRGKDADTVGLAKDIYLARRGEMDSLFSRFTQSHHVVVLDPGIVLCRRVRCEVVADGQSLYQDDDHLAVYGAMKLRPVFAAVFDSLAQSRRP